MRAGGRGQCSWGDPCVVWGPVPLGGPVLAGLPGEGSGRLARKAGKVLWLAEPWLLWAEG